jgi:DNA-binding SARP family transcriptional activator
MTDVSPFPALLETLSAIRSRKAKALCFFLANDFNTSHRAEKVVDLLWQDAEASRAAASYRQAVRQIRRDMPPGCGLTLKTEIGQVSLVLSAQHAGRVTLKDHFRQTVLAQAWDADAASSIRELLAYTTQLEGISGSFDSWLAITRSALSATIRTALDELLAGAETSQLSALRQPAELAVELEPANESAVRLLMNLDWHSGHATRAIERYDLLYRYLDEDFDQEPEAETIELLAAIKLNPTPLPAPVRAVSRRPEVSIAVNLLPSPQPIPDEMRGFATVLYADLRMRMGRFREWRVLDDDSAEPATIMVKLRPVFALGRYQLFADVQTVRESQLLWSEVIDSPETDWEAKVRLLLANLASALSVAVSDRSLSDSGLAIYDRWLKAQTLLDTWSPETEGEALEMLDEITRAAPDFGPAHAELAGALNVRHILLPGTRQTEEVKSRALHHANMAVTVDPLDTRAHRVVGWCYCHKRAFGLAEFHFEQALNLNRSNPLTLASCALGFAFSGNPDRARGLVAEARQHDAVLKPFHRIYIAMVHYLLQDYATSVAEFEQGAGVMPTISDGWHSLALWKLGRQNEAMKFFDQHLITVRNGWHAAAAADNDSIVDWFVNCFPLRDDDTYRDLCATTTKIFEACTTRR